MGGHGGLNILPQKRWNVFNRDNRSKVEKDEREYQQALQKQQEQQIRLEAERKREQLLARSGYSQPSHPKQHKFINFWEKEEKESQETNHQAPQQNQDKEQQRAEKRRRGNPDQYTSDAKFDEKFQFAYGVKESEPWYAKKQKPLSEANLSYNFSKQTNSYQPNHKNEVHDGNLLLQQLQKLMGNESINEVKIAEGQSSLSGMGIKLVSTKDVRANETKKKRDKKSKTKLKSTEDLRKERIERERIERERANLVLVTNGRTSDMHISANGQGYFSGFGYSKKKLKS
eukprot:TRINITY_DN3531_c1_g2_i1.p1 TRINITY_DN3531_c1_g2~~TRINITY_DN3531_c1_g2_i1.p1  ORF type:complete len:286 (+),score=34.70 TRINITY_DN3531_c1_g2_i1:76-933(+)